MNLVMDAKVSAYEYRIASARATVTVIIAEIEEQLSRMMTPEEWSRSLQGLWPEMSESPALEQLVEKYNSYLSLEHELFQIRPFVADEMTYDWYMEDEA